MRLGGGEGRLYTHARPHSPLGLCQSRAVRGKLPDWPMPSPALHAAELLAASAVHVPLPKTELLEKTTSIHMHVGGVQEVLLVVLLPPLPVPAGTASGTPAAAQLGSSRTTLLALVVLLVRVVLLAALVLLVGLVLLSLDGVQLQARSVLLCAGNFMPTRPRR